jgi:hypothetical protein
MCPDLARLLPDQEKENRQVVHAKRPQGVLVRPDRAEVLAVAVDAEHVAELARVDDAFQRADGWVVQQQMAGHQHTAALLRQLAQLLHLAAPHRGRLLDEHVLVRLERPSRELVVRRYGRGDHDGVHRVVGEHVAEARRDARRGMPLGRRCGLLFVDVAEPRHVGELSEVAQELFPPLAQPDLADADGLWRRHSFHTFSFPEPFPPVAFLRSTTTSARSIRSS